MQSNEDTALPDQDTARMPAAVPATAGNTPSALEDVETARLPAIGAGDASTVDTVVTNAVGTARAADAVTNAVADTPTVRIHTVAPSSRPSIRGYLTRFAWLGYPDFWLVILLAAFLRLWHIDLTQFLDDQAQLMSMARDAWLHGALPVTGIPSSIGTLNPPLSIYLLMPFTIFGKDPLPAAISIALWNVLGVALCYIFAYRYFGRIVAASGALLFASCGAAVSYSRFIWQQNYLPPVLALWALTLYLGCVNGRRGWFAPHVALLAVAIMLHPTAALLLPVTLVGFALTPRPAMPSRREWAITVGLLALLLAPMALWEALSGWSDIHLFAHYLRRGSVFNLDVFGFLAAALGAPDAGSLGTRTLYAQNGGWFGVVNAVAVVCFVAGMVVLTARLLRVGVFVWRTGRATAPGGTARLRAGSLAVWRGLRAEPAWRAHLLLWLWIVVPLVLLLRHNSDLHEHYLLALYPVIFIAGGFAVQAAFRAVGRLTAGTRVLHRVAPATILALLGVLLLAQSAQSALYPATLASGAFSAFPTGGYGYPLAEMQQLDGALATLQAEQNAHATFISLSQSYRVQPALDYLMVGEQPDRVGFNPNCLVLPAPDEAPALVVATQPAGLANAMIGSLPELKLVANLAMSGSDDVAVYLMQGKLPSLLGERALTPVSFTDAAGNGLRLDTMALQPDGLMRLRWTVLGSATSAQGTPWYRITPQAGTSAGATHALNISDCDPTRWHAGETVFTWVAVGDATAQTLLLQVRGGMRSPISASVGPVRLLSGSASNSSLRLLRPSSGTTTPDGALAIPLTAAP